MNIILNGMAGFHTLLTRIGQGMSRSDNTVIKFFGNYLLGGAAALNLPYLWTSISTHEDIRANLFKCVCLNGFFCFLYILLIGYFLPYFKLSLQFISSTLLINLIYILVMMLVYLGGVIPFYFFSFFYNGEFCNKTASSLFRNRPVREAEGTGSTDIAEIILSISVTGIFLVQIVLLSKIPFYFGTVFGFALTCWYFSLASFEYSWIYRKFQLEPRLIAIERAWPFFLGFGTPVTLLSVTLPYFVAFTLTSLLIPFLIILASNARVERYKTKLHIFQTTKQATDMLYMGISFIIDWMPFKS